MCVGMPVRMLARLLLHEETEAKPSAKRVPALARASICVAVAAHLHAQVVRNE
jgi:hypothetical protein